MSQLIKLLLADDQVLSRQGYVSLLKDEPNMHVVGEAANGVEVIKLLNKVKPDVILMDIEMPIMDGIEAAKIIKEKFPDQKIIFLSIHFNQSFVTHFEENGYCGMLPKEIDIEYLTHAIHLAVANGSCMELAYALLDETRESKKESIQLGNNTCLTNREVQIINLICSGSSNKEIACNLKINLRTVEFHKTNIYRKLNVSNSAGIAAYNLNLLSNKSFANIQQNNNKNLNTN